MSLSPSARETWRALLVTLGLVVAVCLLLAAHERTFFWQNDNQLYYNPMYGDMVRAWRGGEWPILSPGTWAAQNMGGEYQLAVFSLGQTLILLAIWALPLSLPEQGTAFALVHLCMLAAGVVLLLRQRKLRAEAAVAGALSVALSGYLMTWAAAQWTPVLGTFAWLPWAWWALRKAQAARSRRVRWALPSPFVYLVITGGNPFVVVMLMLVMAWLAARAWWTTRRLIFVTPIVWAGLLGTMLAAPAWWMLLEMSGNCARTNWEGGLHREWIVPWRAWLGLVLPSVKFTWISFWHTPWPCDTSMLLGALVPVAALGELARRRGWRWWARLYPGAGWDLALIGVAIVLCSLPLSGFFRWSFRWLPLFQLALAVAGATALQRSAPGRVARMALLLLAWVLAFALVAQAVSAWALVALEVALLLAWWWLARRGVRWLPVAVTAAFSLAGLVLLDLKQSAFSLTYPMGENLRRPAPLETGRLYLGLYSWFDLIGGLQKGPGWGTLLRGANTTLYADLHIVNGYSSFYPLGVPTWFTAIGNLVSDERAGALTRPEAEPILDLLGVDGLIFGQSYLPFAENLGPEWKLLVHDEEAVVYHREPPRAAPAHTLAVIDTQPGVKLSQPMLTVVQAGRQVVKLRVESTEPLARTREELEDLGLVIPGAAVAAPSAIAFARPYLPGYEAILNGEALPVRNYGEMVPVVELPAGAAGELTLRFRPPSLKYGLPLAGGALALWALLAAWPCGRRQRGSA